MLDYKNSKIAVVGLGYVGLPLACAIAELRNVIGFDVSSQRISELNTGFDKTNEISKSDLETKTNLVFTDDPNELRECEIFIIAVPTPVDDACNPDLNNLLSATKLVASKIRKGALVIYESTVYPGTTEEECVPILSEISGLKYNEDFYCGYSPERANPGDKQHTISSIVKVTSGSTPEISTIVDELYSPIVPAGTYKARSIKVAEAAKLIENTQRDVNIALANEFAVIFNKLNIPTKDVFDAAETKWNFCKFRPGLVGGHCIGVDPYYLAHKAKQVGYHSEMILAGRSINNSIPSYIADVVVKEMLTRGHSVLGSKILVLGFTFKENCNDTRNTKVFDLVQSLKNYNALVDVYDPVIDRQEVSNEYGLDCLETLPTKPEYSSIIIAVPHREFKEIPFSNLTASGLENAYIYDVKSAFSEDLVDAAL